MRHVKRVFKVRIGIQQNTFRRDAPATLARLGANADVSADPIPCKRASFKVAAICVHAVPRTVEAVVRTSRKRGVVCAECGKRRLGHGCLRPAFFEQRITAQNVQSVAPLRLRTRKRRVAASIRAVAPAVHRQGKRGKLVFSQNLLAKHVNVGRQTIGVINAIRRERVRGPRRNDELHLGICGKRRNEKAKGAVGSKSTVNQIAAEQNGVRLFLGGARKESKECLTQLLAAALLGIAAQASDGSVKKNVTRMQDRQCAHAILRRLPLQLSIHPKLFHPFPSFLLYRCASDTDKEVPTLVYDYILPYFGGKIKNFIYKKRKFFSLRVRPTRIKKEKSHPSDTFFSFLLDSSPKICYNMDDRPRQRF